MSRSELGVAVATALLAFLGALGGVYLGSYLDQTNWERRFDLEQRKVVLEKRVALLERAIVVFNKAPIMASYQSLLKAEQIKADAAVACGFSSVARKKGVAACKDLPATTSERIESLVKETNLLGAEYAATVSLCATYFGRETRQAALELNNAQWWSAENAEKVRRLLEAMGIELNAFPK